MRRIGGEDQRPEGLVRLSTTESFTPFLMGGLVPLRQEHPKIQVQLVVSSAALDLVRRDADVALRLFRETNPALVTRKIGEVGWSVYASRGYLERTGFTNKKRALRLSFHGASGGRLRRCRRPVGRRRLAARTVPPRRRGAHR